MVLTLTKLTKPVTAMAADRTGHGCRLVASDGQNLRVAEDTLM
jgi:hypothetical protein